MVKIRRMLVSSLVIALIMGLNLSACAAAPIGTVDGRVPSRFAGQPLAVVSDTSVAATTTYRVRKGDTLYSLARQFGTTVAQLMATNNIDAPESMRIGAELVVPDKAKISGGSLQTQQATIAKAKPRAGGGLVRTGHNSRYALLWPVDGKISSRFGRRGGRNHDGIDIAAREGSNVRAAADGKVLFSAAKGGYGNLILVRHANGLITVYAHNQINLVRSGQAVKAGQTIAKVGQTGRTTVPHLHFEVRRGVKPENPLGHLPP